MKSTAFFVLALLLAAFLSPALADNDQCLMCHRAMAETPVPAHQNCMICHGDGADEHMANIRVPPEPVADETCTMCHRKNDEFLAISAHTQGMECSACHLIHDK